MSGYCQNRPKEENYNETTTINSPPCYTIGHYQICPQEKVVKEFQRIGGVDWDGYTYIPVKDIHFDDTEMYIIGNSILFKERARGKKLEEGSFYSN